MDNTMPPIPEEAYDPQDCITTRLHLAVLHDLPSEQVHVVYQHLNSCPTCAAEHQLLNWSTQLVANLPTSAPSAHVDQAIMAAIAARNREPVLATTSPRKRTQPVRLSRLIGQMAVAAVFLLAMLTAVHFQASQAFAIPASVSWNGFVLYHTETKLAANGLQYSIESYHDLATHRTHVETTMADHLDVVAIGDGHTILGMDMMHHIVQLGADVWSVDDSLFDLATVRNDLQANPSLYLGKTLFNGQDTYRIRSKSGPLLLLNMQYMPVNVLLTSTSQPMYNTLTWLHPSQVPDSMWNMTMPSGFQTGALPAKP